MMAERGIQVDHSTIMRWVHQYSPEIEKKIRRHLRQTNDSWRVDETYIKIKGKGNIFTEQLTQMEIQLISC
jgi:IS6 family transposase